MREQVRWRLAAAVVGGAIVSAAALGGLAWLSIVLSWPHRAPISEPEWGIQFSCDYAEYLILEDPSIPGATDQPDNRPGRAAWCADTLDTLLTELQPEHLRLAVPWDEVEPAPGEFDFEAIDAMLDVAESHGAKVMLTAGVKAPRHPEFYIPGWLLEQVDIPYGADVGRDPLVRERALTMLAAVVEHLAPRDSIESWGVDNEPFQASARAHRWVLGEDFVRAEMAAIRAADPQDRPRVVSHSGRVSWDQSWQKTLVGDIAGINMYPSRRWDIFGRRLTVPSFELGPFTPNWYHRGQVAREHGAGFYITELQAEPWAEPDVRRYSPSNPPADMSPKVFRSNLDYARRSGATRAYLWGAEWWLYQSIRYGDDTWMELGREVLDAPANEALREPD